jgi:hypothetical protein
MFLKKKIPIMLHMFHYSKCKDKEKQQEIVRKVKLFTHAAKPDS